MRRVARASTCAVVLALALAAGARAGGFPQFGRGCARDDFRSVGTTIRAELCRTSAAGGRAVVVLHGCGGFSTFDHRLATELPGEGISTLDVDYFGPTPPPGRKGFCGGPRVGNPFPVWVQVVRDAARALRATSGVDPRGVGVVGWSLGGGVALAAAAGPPATRPFSALAGFSTGAFGPTLAEASGLPPTILLSAGSTDAIPLADTLPLYRALTAAHVPSALYVYPRGSHDWPGRQGTLGIRHAAAFLRKHLR